jgi:hypothetical protein
MNCKALNHHLSHSVAIQLFSFTTSLMHGFSWFMIWKATWAAHHIYGMIKLSIELYVSGYDLSVNHGAVSHDEHMLS